MNFGGYIGAMTAISMINSHGYNECHEDADDEWTEEDIMTDGVKEVAYNPAGDLGKHNHTWGSFIVPSSKWGVE